MNSEKMMQSHSIYFERGSNRKMAFRTPLAVAFGSFLAFFKRWIVSGYDPLWSLRTFHQSFSFFLQRLIFLFLSSVFDHQKP